MTDALTPSRHPPRSDLFLIALVSPFLLIAPIGWYAGYIIGLFFRWRDDLRLNK